MPRTFLFVFLAACGSVETAAPDAGPDASGGVPHDSGRADGSGNGDAASMDDGGGDAQGPACLAQANGFCDPPCASDQVCFARVYSGGGVKLPLDRAADGGFGPGDAGTPTGCYAVPSCAPTDCACLTATLSANCSCFMTACQMTDAGALQVNCVFPAP